jgi:hypothetical protein
MKTLRASLVALGAALSVLAFTASPAFAYGHGGGGGGGGGHSFGGGGHASFGGHSFASHGFASGAHFGGSRVASGAFAYHGYVGSHATLGRSIAPRSAYARPGLGTRYVGAGGRYFGHWGHGWGGGYWRGGYWPGVFWGAGFAWFLPVLPAIYATYYWNSIPYYYYDNVYYTYDPSADGYVVTTPPPALENDGNDDGNEGYGPAASAPQASGPPSGAQQAPPSSDGLYAYPKNGQSQDQQTTDRRECGQWASSQAGAAATDHGSMDYRRALTACLQGRGYSVD